MKTDAIDRRRYVTALLPGIMRSATMLAAMIAASLPVAVLALDPGKSVFQFNCQNWTRLSGLPADKISAVTQTTDGYLWFGTQNGLLRFDGQQFKVIPVDLPEAHGQDIRRLHSTPDGSLWFSINGAGVGKYDGQKFSAVGDARWHAPDINSNAIIGARDGSVWTGSVVGWGRWVSEKPQETVYDQLPGPVITIYEDPLERVWLGTAESGLHYWEKGELKPFPDEELKTLNIQTIVLDHEGDLWVGTGIGLYRYDARFQRKEVYFPTAQTNALLVDSHGIVWAGSHGLGLGRFKDGEFTLLQKGDGLGSDVVTSLFEDDEGSLWVGTVEGLSQLTDLKFPIYSVNEGLVAGGAISVAASPTGGIWVGTTTGASYFDGVTATNYTDPGIFPNRYIRRIFAARNGDVYIGEGSRHICVLNNGILKARYLVGQWPEAFAEDSTGVLAGIGTSLFRLGPDGVEPYRFDGDAPHFDWINALHATADGTIWAATNSGLFRIRDGVVKRWSISDGLSSDRVHSVLEDVDGSIWANLPTGLVRVKDGRVSTITADDGLPDPRIYAVVPDDHGFFWLASGRGILRISRQSLTDFAEGRIPRVVCETFDGLESVKFIDRTEQGYSGCKSLDGRIWFPNPRGVVMIDPAGYVTNRVAPRVYIENVRVQSRDFGEQSTAKLHVGERRVEFFFTALSYIAPKKIQIRYQLEGHDPSWIDAGVHRSVVYNNLSAGSYKFRIQAANADGVWNLVGDDFTILLPPPFYQRMWFYAACGAFGLVSLFGGYRWKIRHMRELQGKLSAQNDLLETKVRLRTGELASSLSLLKATLDSTADGIVAVQLSDRAVSHNQQFSEMWRIPPELLDSTNADELVTFTASQTKNPAQFMAGVDRMFAAPDAEAFDVIELTDGRIFERYCKPRRMNQEIVGIVINFRDITERKRSEAAIAEASALLDSLMTNTLDMLYFKDLESRFVRYSEPLALRHHLAHRDDLVGKSDFDLFPEAEAKGFFEEEQAVIKTGQPLIDKLSVAANRDGKVAWVMTTKTPWRDLHGNIIGTFGIARDVTALKMAEVGLAYERDLLKALLDSSPDQIYFKDSASRFIRCSQAQAAIFRTASTDELLGKTDFDFFLPEHAQTAFDDEVAIMRTGEPLIGKVEREVWLDGRITWVLTSKIPLRDSTGAIIGTVGISKDITALKQAEEKLELVHKQLLETSRQAGMAEVATSVLHNVGNVLNSVNVSATLVTEQMRTSKVAFVPKIGALLQSHAADLSTFLTADPKGIKIPVYLATLGDELLAEQRMMSDELGHLRKNIEHIKEIVAMQQSFSKVCGVAETVPLAELVEDALRINISALSRHEVELVRDYQFEPTLTLERHKLIQILVNLIRNAKYACDEGGRPDKRVTVRITKHEQKVQIAVIDTGVGIPAENLTRIFAHGFTTKKEGHGFGLHSGALAARELGGSLTVFSEGSGKGATFIIELPLDPEPIQGT